MVKREQGKSSSSQNDNIRVKALIRRGVPRGTVLVLIEDSSSFFMLSSLCSFHSIGEGTSWTLAKLLELQDKSWSIYAAELVNRYICLRDHSQHQLEIKLQKKGVPRDFIDLAIAKAIETRLIDDLRFARQWLRNRIQKRPKGLGGLRAGLLHCGVSRDTVEVAISEIHNEDIVGSLERAGEKYLQKKSATKEKCIRYLLNNGFLYHEIMKFVENKFASIQ